MPYTIRRLYCDGRPRAWEVLREDGSFDVPQMSAEVGAHTDAVTLCEMLNSVHPDAMVAAVKAGAASTIPEDVA